MSKYFMYTIIYVTPETIYSWVQVQEEIDGFVCDSVESPRYYGAILAEPVLISSEISEDLFKIVRKTLTREISI